MYTSLCHWEELF